MPNLVQRLSEEASLGTISGIQGIFDPTGDRDLMSLSFQGVDPFMDWIGWSPSRVWQETRGYIHWVRPAYANSAPTIGYVSDPCADPAGVEYGAAEFMVSGFGRLRRAAPTRDVTRVDVKKWAGEPRRRLDGTPITDDREFGAYLATEVILQDLKHMLVSGNSTTSGQFDGLEKIVRTGITDYRGRRVSTMDSTVIDWNGNTMTGGSGATWNGASIPSTASLIDTLRAAVRQVRQKTKWAPALAAQNYNVGDTVIVLPDFLAYGLLDQYVSWKLAAGAQYNETVINQYEARALRAQIDGGLYGFGEITLDGRVYPLISYDWGLVNNAAGTVGDIYVLTRGIGGHRFLYGEYLQMDQVPSAYPEASYFYTDGGRLLGWIESDHTCIRQIHEMQPRLSCWAPWAQVRIQDVRYDMVGGYISPDPTSSFFPESSFTPAAAL